MKEDIEEAKNASKEEVVAKDTLSFLALGDSYTIGQSVVPEGRWVSQLADYLNITRSFSVQEPEVIATTGWTTADLLSAIKASNKLGDSYDMVSLLIGVNNQYRAYYGKQEQYTEALYSNEFKELLELSISLADNNPLRVMVLSIPDYAATSFVSKERKDDVSKELGIYNAIAKAICVDKGVNFIDITPISKLALEDEKLTASDGLHPSKTMYSLWVEKVIDSFDFQQFD